MKKENKSRFSEEKKSNYAIAMALTATISVIVLFITTFILLQLKFKDPIKITLSDWLKLIIPIVGGAVITIFAFLGVDRLKNFDERQDRLESQLRNDLTTQVDNAVKLMQPQLNEIYSEWEKDVKNKLSDYNSLLSVIEKRINRYDAIIGSVEKLEEVSDAIGNVNEAHDFVTGLPTNSSNSSDKSQSTRIILALVERVKNGEIKGDSADYHNLASELARRNYYEYAADVTEKGLELFGDNIDLLSDYTYYSHKAGRKNNVAEGLAKLEKIEKNIWNWRAFTFYIDVLNDGEANQENRSKTITCVESYKSVHPSDERAYMAEYETLKKYGNPKEAEKALLTAETALSMTAQCSLTLSGIYHKRGEYDKSIISATRAIIGQADVQPSSNTSTAFALRAFARDAKIHKAILEGMDINILYSEIKDAISDFKMATQLGCAYDNIYVRIQILQSLLPVEEQEQIKLEELEAQVNNITKVLGMLLSKIGVDNEE